MAIPFVGVGAKITAALLNALIGAANSQAETAVVPTSVAGTGVSVGAAGKVSFAAASTVSINGCFTSTYDNYRVEITADTATSLSASVVLRSAGTNVTTATYDYALSWAVSTTPASTSATAQSAVTISVANTATAADWTLLVRSPARTVPTIFRSVYHGVTTATGANMLTGIGGGSQRGALAFDGFTITFGGTPTGSIRIYGSNSN